MTLFTRVSSTTNQQNTATLHFIVEGHHFHHLMVYWKILRPIWLFLTKFKVIKSIKNKWCSEKMIPQLIRLRSMPIYGSEHHFFFGLTSINFKLHKTYLRILNVLKMSIRISWKIVLMFGKKKSKIFIIF